MIMLKYNGAQLTTLLQTGLHLLIIWTICMYVHKAIHLLVYKVIIATTC